MVNVNALGGYDNVTFPAGWDNQGTTPTSGEVGTSLESYGGGTLGVSSNPAANSYLAWTTNTEDAVSTVTATTGNGYLFRVVASSGGSCGHLDVASVSGTFTNAVFGLYSGASFATGPLVWTADAHASFGSAVMVSMTWNGASSPSSVNLVAGTTYWLYMELTGTSPAVSGVVSTSAATLNANLAASASFANNAMTLASGPSTLAANTTLTPQTSWANTTIKAWAGLRT